MSADAPVPSGGNEVKGDGFTVYSNSESKADMERVVAEDKKEHSDKAGDDDDEGDDVRKAASALGKKGGEAAAKAKAKAAKDSKAAEAKAAEDEAKEAKPSDEDEDKPGNPRHDARARVEQATRQAAEARQELERERRERQRMAERLEALERRTQQPAQGQEQPRGYQPPPDDPNDPRPKEEEFENYADFVEARGSWAARREYARIQQQQEAEHHARQIYDEMSRRGGEVKGVIDKAREAVPDLDQRIDPRIMNLVPTWTLGPGARPGPLNIIADALTQVEKPEHFAALALHLTEHPEEVPRIASLKTPGAIIAAMARLEARVAPSVSSEGSEERAESFSRAHPPIRPVSGASAVVPEPGSDDESFEKHMQRENAREERERKRRAGL